MTVAATLTATQRSDFLETLDVESLVELLQWTGYGDDQALRRSLSELIVGLEAVHQLRSGRDIEYAPGVIEAAEASLLAQAGEFVAEVLGPGLIGDSGNSLCRRFLPLVNSTSALVQQYEAAVAVLAAEATGRVIERNETLTAVIPEHKWNVAGFHRGAIGQAQLAYSAGYTLSATDYFGAAGLAVHALATADPSGAHGVDASRSTLAAIEKSGSWDPEQVQSRAVLDGGQWQITGDKYFVPGAEPASAILVVARTEEGLSLFRVDHGSSGAQIESMDSLDVERPLSHITFEQAAAVMIGHEGVGAEVMRRTAAFAANVLAGEQVGLIEGTLKRISEIPPSGRDDESWRRYTREIAAIEVVRSTASALWVSAARQQDEDTDLVEAASMMAHIGCSAALRRLMLRLDTITSELDPTAKQALGVRARTTELYMGGPARTHELLLKYLGI